MFTEIQIKEIENMFNKIVKEISEATASDYNIDNAINDIKSLLFIDEIIKKRINLFYIGLAPFKEDLEEEIKNLETKENITDQELKELEGLKIQIDGLIINSYKEEEKHQKWFEKFNDDFIYSKFRIFINKMMEKYNITEEDAVKKIICHLKEFFKI